MLIGDGDGFVRCACGQRHWGLFGAAGLLLSDPRRGVLLQHRAGWTHQGGSWALPGGAVQSDETSAQAAARETEEETAVPGAAFRVLAQRADDHGTWRYTTVLAGPVGDVPEPRVTNAESTALRWVPPAEVADYPLHAGFAAAWPELCAQLDRELVLVVDAADVAGAGPDGGVDAAARLRDSLGALACAGVRAGDAGLDDLPEAQHWLWWPRVVLVVAGAASATETVDGVEIVRAGADAGAAMAAVTRGLRAERPRDHVVVVTADRQVGGRVATDASAVIGPGSLRRALEACA